MIDKSRLPSRHVSLGAKSSPHRSYYYAMGLTEKEINQPLLVLLHVGMNPHHVIFHFQDKPRQQKKELKIVKELLENLPQSQLQMVLQWVMRE